MKRWSEQEKADFRTWRELKVPYAEIATRLGRSVNAIVAAAYAFDPIAKRSESYKRKISVISAEYSNGYGAPARAAAALGMTNGAVRQFAKRNGLRICRRN